MFKKIKEAIQKFIKNHIVDNEPEVDCCDCDCDCKEEVVSPPKKKRGRPKKK